MRGELPRLPVVEDAGVTTVKVSSHASLPAVVAVSLNCSKVFALKATKFRLKVVGELLDVVAVL